MDPDKVFKAYDIRGRTDTGEIDTDLYFRIGAALVDVLETDRFAVGRDCRPSSEDLTLSLIDGLIESGTSSTTFHSMATSPAW
jgi:phosphomannomutase